MTKNPSWIQFTDDIWGEAVGGTDHNDYLRSLDAPSLPAAVLDPLPDVTAPTVLTWLRVHLLELVESERMRAVGPHGNTFQRHADMLAEVAHLDAARRTATGDLRDQIARQHREAKQELSDFERGDRFQSALRHYLDAAGPAFDRIAAATPENPAAVLYQQEARVRYEALIALTTPTTTEQKEPPEGRHRQQGTLQADTVRRGRQRSNAPERLEEILVALESYAANTEQEFDRSSMPGPLGDDWQDQGSFHWLCAQIDPVFKKAKSTFEKHRAGLCAIRLYATKTDFYKQALPYIAPTLKRGKNVHQMPQRPVKVS